MQPVHDFRRLALTVATLMVLAGTGPVRAAESAPFSAELSAVFIGPDREAALFALDGTATHMGDVTGVARNEARGPRELGVLRLENAASDTLVCSYEFATATGVGRYTVTGGDGRLKGATGSGTITVGDRLPDGSVPITLDGTITFSKPFSAELTAVFVGRDREALLFALEGAATHMGNVTGMARHEVRGPRELGVLRLEDDTGDTLVCFYKITYDPVLAEGTFVIVSGTGRFQNAIGGGILMVDETHSPGEPFPVWLEGTISF